MTPGFWRGKRVLLTGHTGFKGSWLALWLHHWGAEVTGFALAPNTTPSLFDVIGVDRFVDSVIADIRDPEAIARVLKNAAPDIVIHMAAQPLVRYSYRNPVETYHTNVLGTVHLLDAVRNTPSVRALVNVTTDKCYENREWEWGYRENDPLGGHDPYSSSKACAEIATAAFRSSFFPAEGYGRTHHVAVATARAGNVIGGGDWSEDRLVPDIMRAIAASKPVLVRAPGAIRPWQHVLEPLSGYLMLAERLYEQGPPFAQAWNFGPGEGDTRPVAWIAGELTRLWGPGASWELAAAADQPHEAHYLKLDCSRARQVLGWQPRWTLPVALERIVAWHRAWAAGEDMLAASMRDIRDYLDARAA